MKKRFERLPYGTLIGDLTITPKNREFIDRFIEHLQGYVTKGGWGHSTRAVA